MVDFCSPRNKIPTQDRRTSMTLPRLTDPKFLIPFTAYAFLIGLLAARRPEVVKELSGAAGDGAGWFAWMWWAGDFVCILVLLWIYDPVIRRWFRERDVLVSLNPTSSQAVRPARGLMLLVSRGDG